MTKLFKKSLEYTIRVLPLKTLHAIPDSWEQAAGMANKKKKALKAHIRRIRNEWNK